MKNFNFIHDVRLQEKIQETYNYIKFLLSLEKNNLEPDILFSLNKDIIIHTTAVLEWLLTYLLIAIQEHGTKSEKSIIKSFLIKKEYKKVKTATELTFYKGDIKLYFAQEKVYKGKLNGKLNIGILINVIKKLNIFNASQVEGLEDIQKIRNDVHIQRILDNNIYEHELTDEKMLELFQFTRDIQELMKNKLEKLGLKHPKY